jgi:CRISPR-associated protein Cmr4
MYWLHALTALHVGAGGGIGFIDLPIMREAVTNWPLVPGSAVKGVLADFYGADEDARDPANAGKYKSQHRLAFGRAGAEHSNSGALVFTDARLICLPVRSLYGTFAWCTAPLVLARLHRDLERQGLHAGLKSMLTLPGPDGAGPLRILVPDDPASKLCGEANGVYFEDLDFRADTDEHVKEWSTKLAGWAFPDESRPDGTEQDNGAWRTIFRGRFAVVPDDVFTFLCDTATQVDARVRIDDATRTASEGALWYEESLPAESILAGYAWCDKLYGFDPSEGKAPDLLAEYCTQPRALQIGGKATVGRGQVRMTFTPGA